MTEKKLNNLVEKLCDSKVTEKDQNYLLEKYLNGDINAMEALFSTNLNLVSKVMSRFSIAKNDVEDVFQVGCIGLMKALRSYQFNSGKIFSVHAIEKILKEIYTYSREMAPKETVLNEDELELYNKIEVCTDALATELCREPNSREISEKLNIDIKTVERILRIYQMKMELPRQNVSDNTGLFFETCENRIVLNKILKELSSREKLFVSCYFCNLMSKEEMALEFGCTREEVARLEESVLSKLKKYGEQEKDKPIVKTK